MNNNLTWRYQSFYELSLDELYKILKIRSEVFIVEQNCPYQDVDGKDQQSFHLSAWIEDAPVAYVRIIPPGISYKEASIGRVLTVMSQRKSGTGKILMEKAIEHTLREFNVTEIKIGAQLYLQKFYTSLGFKQTSALYLEDNIPHIEMLYSK
jgi:ElaA protein